MPYCNALFYRRYDGGAGVSSHPTILLHGLGGSHLSWPPMVRRLSNHTIYAIDLPGHGHSNNGTCVEMECLTQALEQFVRLMHFEQINLVGHSMGAMVAHAFASQFPQAIRSLTLMSIGEIYPRARQLELCFIREKTRIQAIQIFLREGFHPAFPRHMRRKLLAPLLTTRLSLLHADAMVCANFEPGRYFHEMEFPVSIMCGRDDALVPVSGTRNFASQIANAKLDILEHCGHFLIYEQPEAVANLLNNFLNQNG